MDMTSQPDRAANVRIIAACMFALTGGAITATACMVMPLAPVEAAIQSIGMPELVPAAAPPLGATARLAIAISAGLVIAALIYILFPRKGASKMGSATNSEEFAQSGALGWLRIPRFGAKRNDLDYVSDFDDLPDLRSSDRHPDAPPKRPIFASSELGARADMEAETPDLAPVDVPDAMDEGALYQIASTEAVLTLTEGDIAEDDIVDGEMITIDEPHSDLPLPTAEDALSGLAVTVDRSDQISEPPKETETGDSADPAAADNIAPNAAITVENVLKRRTQRGIELGQLGLDELVDRLENGIKRRNSAQASHDVEVKTSPDNAAPNVRPSDRPTSAEPTDEADSNGMEKRSRDNDMDGALTAALETLRQMADRQRNAS